MTDKRDQLEELADVMLKDIERPLLETVESNVRMIAAMPTFADIDDATITAVIRSLEARHQVSMSLGSMLVDTDWKPWANARRADIDPYYWNRYKLLLQKKKLSNQVVGRMDSVTENILNLLQNPEDPGQWDRRGLVMGHVQSGKTSNFIGLITKAADAGYKVIIVVAGLTNVLREQTQKRIDEGFIGWDTSRPSGREGRKVVGVGLQNQERPPVSYTTANRDFSAQTATLPQSLDSFRNPSVFVIKKNSRALDSLITWLRSYTARGESAFIDLPMLLIDDESDNASINIASPRNEVSRINGQLRSILSLFRRSSYVGYTATPFANIFIDPDSDDEMVNDDLFPRDFIVSLDPPSNYFGPETVFLEHPDTYLRVISDNESLLPLKHKKDLEVRALPDSLKEAVRTFIVGRAIRIARGQGRDHASMMINASVLNLVQRQIADRVQEYLSGISDAVRLYGNMPVERATRYASIAALKDTFEKEFVDSGIPWASVQSLLLEAVAPIDVIQVNGLATGTLDYDQYKESGRHVIAVGGYSLSRGVTLEGLQVSYFLRNSMAYDTLMQMGRWFGYRDGYEDLCRIWMPRHASEWYAHISEATTNLREQLRRMEQVRATPMDFGLAVRAHPDSLVITARNKMGRSERLPVKVGLADKFSETIQVMADPAVNQRNLRLMEEFVRRASEEDVFQRLDGAQSGWSASGVSSELVAGFIRAFESPPHLPQSDSRLVSDYIVANASTFPEWDVFVPSLRKPGYDGATIVLDGMAINLQQRTLDADRGGDGTLYLSRRGKVASRGVESVGLSPSQVSKAEELFRAYQDSQGRSLTSEMNDRFYRQVRTRPLLVLHLLYLTHREKGEDPVMSDPVAAWSISFPPTLEPEQTVECFVNAVYLQDEFLLSDLDEEEELVRELE